jgi:phosphate starvation-inducible PhoH-like protein
MDRHYLEVYLEDGLTIVLGSGELLPGICGANDGNLKAIEDALGGRIAARGNEVRIEGVGPDGVRRFKTMVDSLAAAVRAGEAPAPDYVEALAGTLGCGGGEAAGTAAAGDSLHTSGDPLAAAGDPMSAAGDPLAAAMIQIPHGFRRVYPRGRNQAAYVEGMRSSEIAFCVGPAGTGKTYLAIAEALRLVLSKKLRKLVLTRPVVEAGENLGFLPGDLAQKISPYLRPLYDAMESLVPYEVIRRMEETRAIEIAPLAYMRGRSLNDCAVILDEAQNATKEQMKMFLTRIGAGARAVITGDATQIDLPRRTESGLLHAVDILNGVEGIHFSFLHTADVVRNPLIKKIIQAYDEKET